MFQIEDTAVIRALLDEQEKAWNRGDLDAFMQGYWHDPRLRYANGNEIVLGWERLLADYRIRYSDRTEMGTLHFSDVEVQSLGDDGAVVYGRFALQCAHSHPHGTYTLVLRKLPISGWRIVSDQTSVAS